VRNGLILDGTASMGGNAAIRFQGPAQTLGGTGDIVFLSSGSKKILVDSGSKLTIASGIAVRGGSGEVGSDGVLVNEGLINADQPGEIAVNGAQGWTNAGTMRASAGDLTTTGSGINSGTIEIGAGRTLTAEDGFRQEATGVLSIDIDGTTSFGTVAVTGTARLDGTLDINLTSGFSPGLGDTFTVMTFDSRTDDFAAIDGLEIGGGKAFEPSYTATSLVLEVVSQ
jgi:hypothetical protein